MTKQQFRKKSLLRLRKLSSKSNFFYHQKKLILPMEHLINSTQYKNILIYLPLDFEINLTSLINKYRGKKNFFIPFIEDKSFKVVKYRLPLKINKYKILEAKNSFYNFPKLDLAIIPTIAIDRSMKRVGFGKGMYDRFFANYKSKPYMVFIQSCQNISRDIITNHYDIKCDLYITSKIITNGKIKN